MLKFLRKFAVLALLLVMPLQGIAASLTYALCPTTSAPVQLADGHDGHAGGPHEHDGSTDTTHSANLCCHHVFVALPLVVADNGSTEPPVFGTQHRYSTWLFDPEQPQRVPLA